MYIDVHAHINDEKLIDNVEEIIENAKENKVEKIICSASDFPSSEKAVMLAEKYENVYATCGIHPEDCFSYNTDVYQKLKILAENKKVVAIGEIGLDYYNIEFQKRDLENEGKFLTDEEIKQKQKEVFISQINLANELNLPIVVHTRDAMGDTLNILKSNKEKLKNGGLIHCYSGSVESAKEFFSLGFYISVGGVITFKNSVNIQNVIKQVGIERVMLETDCPYLSPEPFRGKLNEPKNIPLVADKISNILEILPEKVGEITSQNAKNLFRKMVWLKILNLTKNLVKIF